MLSRSDTILAALGVPPETEDSLERWERMRPKPEPEPPPSKLDIAHPTLAEIDQFIEPISFEKHEFLPAGIIGKIDGSYLLLFRAKKTNQGKGCTAEISFCIFLHTFMVEKKSNTYN